MINENTLLNLIDKVKYTTISYIDSDGYPVSKAMLAPREHDGLHTFWFSTNTSSNKVQQFKQNPKASIYFIDQRFFRGISLSGTIEVIEDTTEKEKIWRDGDEMYYSKGITDPDYCVLKFNAIKGRFYSNFKSKDFSILNRKDIE